MRYHWLIPSACVCLILALAAPAWAMPGMNISGRLLDSTGNPIRYTQQTSGGPVEIRVELPAQLKFYASETTTTVVATITTTAEAQTGYFSISFSPPDAVLALSNPWYTLAIDADRNGLTSADLFAGRFDLGSVPYALSTQPLKSFTAHQGMSGNPWGPGPVADGQLMVVPFAAPPGGVEFNRMNIHVYGADVGTVFSFGIYDDQGNLVVTSSPIVVKGAAIDDAFLEIKHSRKSLAPAKTYYTALLRKTGMFSFKSGIKPPAPIYGWLPVVSTTGDLPAHFSPAQISPTDYAIALPIYLSLVEIQPAGGAASLQPSGATTSYRWIKVASHEGVQK